jgi:hypothetical protein
MHGPWGRVDGLGWVDQGGSKPAPHATATGVETARLIQGPVRHVASSRRTPCHSAN